MQPTSRKQEAPIRVDPKTRQNWRAEQGAGRKLGFKDVKA